MNAGSVSCRQSVQPHHRFDLFERDLCFGFDPRCPCDQDVLDQIRLRFIARAAFPNRFEKGVDGPRQAALDLNIARRLCPAGSAV